jgi:predicted DNA-binding protein with PD1-like motif
MQVKLLNARAPRMHAVILETGEEAIAALTDFAVREQIDAAHLTAIGAFERAVLGFYDLERKEYKRIPVDEQAEVLSLIGDIALDKDKPKLHAHVTLGLSDGTTRGGHLLEAIVRPTLEVIFSEPPAWLKRVHDEATGLSLIRTDAA